MSQSNVASTAMLIIDLFVSGINMLSRFLYMLHVKQKQGGPLLTLCSGPLAELAPGPVFLDTTIIALPKPFCMNNGSSWAPSSQYRILCSIIHTSLECQQNKYPLPINTGVQGKLIKQSGWIPSSYQDFASCWRHRAGLGVCDGCIQWLHRPLH